MEEAIINAGVRSEEGTAMSRGTAADAADSKAAVLPTLPPPAAKKVKAKTHITSKEYDDITQLLILRVKNLEALDDQSDTYKGVRWGDLLSYYLEQFSDTLRSEELFDAKKKVVNQGETHRHTIHCTPIEPFLPSFIPFFLPSFLSSPSFSDSTDDQA